MYPHEQNLSSIARIMDVRIEKSDGCDLTVLVCMIVFTAIQQSAFLLQGLETARVARVGTVVPIRPLI